MCTGIATAPTFCCRLATNTSLLRRKEIIIRIIGGSLSADDCDDDGGVLKF
jgi:hypothetical protein